MRAISRNINQELVPNSGAPSTVREVGSLDRDAVTDGESGHRGILRRLVRKKLRARYLALHDLSFLDLFAG
jgi:hypothetical protein